MKTIKYQKYLIIVIIITCLFPLQLFSQNLTGMWTGKIYTTEKTLAYEVAISEMDGKLSGFSYTTFTVKGEEMVAMKSVIVKKEKNSIIIEDVDLVFNSFDEESPKQLKQTNTLELEIVNENTMLLIGKFKTLKTDKYRSMSGGVRLRKDSIIEQPKLIAKLEEMDLSKSLSFMPPPAEDSTKDIAKQDSVMEDVARLDKIEIEATKANTGTKKDANAPTVKAAPKTAKPNLKPVAIISKSKPAAQPVAGAKPNTTVPAAIAAATPPPATASKKTDNRPGAGTPFATKFGDRTLETIQTVAYKSDSLTLTLYDNGEVDGDTVSVILNGKTIISKQGLSTRAITKTISTTELADSIQLIMFAENLGTIPPNTGLLIIKDGRDRYEIRFAGDLKKNAAVVLRRRTSN